MNFGWRFHLGEAENAVGRSHSAVYCSVKAGNAGGVPSLGFDDSAWREVTLPHDYFTESEIAEENLLSGGYRKQANAWYRKTFKLDGDLKNKRLFLCFEGTSVFAEFYLNGSLMKRSFSGSAESYFEITDRAYFGERPNILAVHINGFAKQGWWYEGAGIYRNVSLVIKPIVNITHNGIFVKPILNREAENDWQIEIETTLENGFDTDTKCSVKSSVYDGDTLLSGTEACEITVPFSDCKTIKQVLSVKNPRRWDVDSPNLYQAEIELFSGDVCLESERISFGFRTFYMDPDKGFFLNGRPLKIKGTCNHQDHAGVGVAVPKRLQYLRIELLKEMGTNAFRTAHNFPAEDVLDACDRLGMIVLDENRTFETDDENLENLKAMIRRDRNHPSVIFYSLFNEEPLQCTEEGAKMYSHLKNTVRRIDDTRLITGAINSFEPYEGAGEKMDVLGLNYGLFSIQNVIEKTHKILPKMPILGTEACSAVSTRGCFCTDKKEKQVMSSYDEECVSWGNTISQCWDFTRKNDYYSGIFVWTGFDYRGEPTPFRWPSVSSQFGILDTCGFKKSAFYYYQACFRSEPMINILPHWEWEEGETVRVEVATNCEEAELFLNGASLGIKKADCCASPRWDVPFKKGTLTAKGYNKGVCVAEHTKTTPTAPFIIKAESAYPTVSDDGQDIVIVNCSVADAKGNLVETAENELHFEIIGDACLIGVGNGNPNSHESDVLPKRKLFAGKAQAIIRVLPKGKNVKIRVCAEGLGETVLIPDIRRSEPLKIIPGTVDYYIHTVTQSCVTKHRPNPIMKIADNDMNTFTAVHFSFEHFQHDFTAGWRIYRIKTRLNQTNMLLVLQSVRGSLVDIYINEELCLSAEKCNGEKITCPVCGIIDRETEIRILIKGYETGENGIQSGILLMPLKKGIFYGDI